MEDFCIEMGDFKILNEMEDFVGFGIWKISIPFRFIACPGHWPTFRWHYVRYGTRTIDCMILDHNKI